MKLAQLLSVFPQLRWGEVASQDVQGLTQDSRQVKEGVVFVAVRGHSSDGHRFLKAAAEADALALIVEDDREVPSAYSGAVVKVPDTRKALDLLAERYYAHPAKNLFCVGITGTNGKTTTAYMVERVLTAFGWPTGVLGTVDHHLGEHRWSSQLTTPDPLTLQSRLREFVSLGAQAAVFEVSSHALDQSRADSLPFAVGIFTNFTRDHLDYHHSMENYFAAKEKLFTELLGRDARAAVAVLNIDDPWIRRVKVGEGVGTWWYGQDPQADFHFRVLKEDLSATLFHLSTPHGNTEVQLACPGLHNVYNATAALAVGLAAGMSLETAATALSRFHGAPGRLERVPNSRGLFIFVDYAHTDDALRTVLRALKEMRKAAHSTSKIITVFGCGGDRDRGKRPLMAQAACEHSDVVILTSDNPRSEDPLRILSEIEAGIPSTWAGRKIIEPDREQALARALQTAQEGDVILIAGKGHEDYQIIGDRRLSFSDQKIMVKLLNHGASL